MATRGMTRQHPNFHTAPSQASPVIEVLLAPTALEILGQENDYYHVELSDGRLGYIHTSLVTPQTDGPSVTAPSSRSAASFSSAADINQWFSDVTGLDFISWFNTQHARTPIWSGISILDGRPREGFTKLWDRLAVVFDRPTITLEQFLGLVSIVLNETGGQIWPITELVGMAGHPGIAYAFDRIPRLKVSYNQRPNRTAGDLFRDPTFSARFARLPLAARVTNTQDPRWDGDVYPVGDFPHSTDPNVSGIILQADFFKFRGRGFIQTTWRSGYKPLIEFIQQSDDPNPVLQRYKGDWTGVDPEVVATTSTNADWDALFQQTDCLVACAGIRLHNQGASDYLSLSSDRPVLAGEGPGSAFNCGLRVSGGRMYATKFRTRVLQLRDSLPA